jgi:Na+/H+ antiporter NhaD/arsenite permease-like protein
MGIEHIMIIVFIIGYLMIATEHLTHINKAAGALLAGMICWGLYAVWPAQHLGVEPAMTPVEILADDNIREAHPDFAHFIQQDALTRMHEGDDFYAGDETPEILNHYVQHGLAHHFFDMAGILLFLLGAMAIVEVMDAHGAFTVITNRIKAVNKVSLLWIVSIITFFMSAVLDNLTTAIVMIAVVRALISETETKWLFGGFVIIAANSGGAWSPIGDVTTTMLWNNGQVPDTLALINTIFFPALASLVVPLLIASIFVKGNVDRPGGVELSAGHSVSKVTVLERNFIFILGIAGLLFVPVWKNITHLPPYSGMMFSLGVVWLVCELMQKSKMPEKKQGLSVVSALQRIDTSSVLFFLGILMAVSALQEVGHLNGAAVTLNEALHGNLFVVNLSIGLLSAVVDNVPLVAAAQGMYPIAETGDFAANGSFWTFLAFCAGTGGSILIIGSAAGVAVMGLEKISFGWYFKKVSAYALAGYLAGAGVFFLLSKL